MPITGRLGSELETREFQANANGQLRWPGGQARCALGRGGLLQASDKRESDGATPIGMWPMRRVLYRPDRLQRPVTALPVTRLTPQMGWCDDPMDVEYNRQVRLPFHARHEVLWREDHVYDVIVELGVNDDPVITGRGSAIFLHVARPDYSPTEGCVACALPDLRELIGEARPGDGLRIMA
ncbi:MAG TPA: L,D-transpeptidase family protein [Hyphomonadaceae bacterium]|jgi:L,D-peptidoglycan transpeptidase YkuD (ErfK/YbiS/YcfS/YnhG family)|nr:L,D-transpeptidase family protein [Hyphomonadaceae bacterium]